MVDTRGIRFCAVLLRPQPMEMAKISGSLVGSESREGRKVFLGKFLKMKPFCRGQKRLLEHLGRVGPLGSIITR